MPFQSRNGGKSGDSLRQLTKGARSAGMDALLRAALILEGNIKTILLTPGRGRLRDGGIDRVGAGSFRTVKGGVKKLVRRGIARSNIDLTNRASSPGDPPAPDSGTLQRSITHEVDGNSVRVGTNVEYAEPLEFGTTTAGKKRNVVILPRPFMRPALAASKEQMTEAVVATLKRGARRGN